MMLGVVVHCWFGENMATGGQPNFLHVLWGASDITCMINPSTPSRICGHTYPYTFQERYKANNAWGPGRHRDRHVSHPRPQSFQLTACACMVVLVARRRSSAPQSGGFLFLLEQKMPAKGALKKKTHPLDAFGVEFAKGYLDTKCIKWVRLSVEGTLFRLV